MNIWVDENIPLGKETFGAYGRVVPFAGRGLTRENLLGEGGSGACDALMVRSVTKVNPELLQDTSVRFVGTATIGTDHVDLNHLARQGIGFASAPGSNANSVAEYVTAALLLLRQEKGFDFTGKTLALIGYGNVGKQVEKKALALGMRVLRCDPPLQAQAGTENHGFSSREEVIARAEVISLHVPLVKSGPHPTLNLVDAEFFAALPRPIVLFNTCRGGVIEETALKTAMRQKKITHLVLDVFAGEPRIDPEVAALADLVSPHIAGYSLEGKLNGTAQIAEAFRSHFGLPPAPRPEWPKPAQADIAFTAAAPATHGAPEMQGDWDFLHRCVQRAYDIRSDDGRLRASLTEADPAKAFDRLRKEYPVRHEFPAYRVTGVPAEKRELRSRLNNLGFR